MCKHVSHLNRTSILRNAKQKKAGTLYSEWVNRSTKAINIAL